jgi:HPt (histidine-containing phosphotransfer) domain-containing protein
MTANVTPEDREACREAGMDDYLSKPIRVEGLVVALKACKPLAGWAPGAEASPVPPPLSKRAGADGVIHVDPAALEQLRLLVNGDLASLAELVQSYLDETPKVIASISTGLEQRDAATVRRGAHSLKSTSRDFGAVRLAELGAALESRAKALASPETKPPAGASTWAGMAEMVGAIESEWSLARAALTMVREGFRS